MSELRPIPFPDLLRRMRREAEVSDAIFDLPARKWFRPSADFDFGAMHFGRRASTPVGPAAGPHTQLAQNIVLSWLGGARIVELKTVQVNDRLEIPRPCIHVPNVGYNVEWSQELLVEESLREYAKAVYLIEILKATRVFGKFDGDAGFDSSTDTVYDISVGYDLEGIRSEKVTGFLRAMRESTPHFDALRGQLDGDLATFRNLPLPPSISDCVTLSTFHGCPADQIESIARYLIQEIGLHTIIKLNPTLLGFEAVRDILVDRLGYADLELRPEAFDADLRYEDGLEIIRRLRTVAEAEGTEIGAKFTNTLVVANRPEFFATHTDPYMYVSGPPLHVISMTLMQRFREDLDFEFPVSFSAGIDRVNFPDAVASGMVPVTTCTDLLRQGGYGRLPRYLVMLRKTMERAGVTSREAFVLGAKGHGAEAVGAAVRSLADSDDLWRREGERLTGIARDRPDELPFELRAAASRYGLDGDTLVLKATRIAGRLNGREMIPGLLDDDRYRAGANRKEPRRIDSTLELYDCINCDLCISACPNDAIFAYETEPVEVATERLRVGTDGTLTSETGSGFVLRESHQLALVDGACNECSNCEVYCPERGAPFRVKEHVFMSVEAFERPGARDGFVRAEDGRILARLDGHVLALAPEDDDGRISVEVDGSSLGIDPASGRVADLHGSERDGVDIDTAILWRLRVVRNHIFHSVRPNPVNPDPQSRGDRDG